MMMALLHGCSLPIKTVYVQPKKVNFNVSEINASSVPVFKPRDIEVSKDGTKITTTVDTFLKIKSITKKLRLKAKIYQEAFFSLKRQVERYNKRIKELKKDEGI